MSLLRADPQQEDGLHAKDKADARTRCSAAGTRGRDQILPKLRKLEEEHFDAIVLAVAGLKRLGFADRITEVLPKELLLPAVGQGALAIETRADDAEVRRIIAFLNDEDTVNCARAERAFLARVEGGCQVPVGVHATAEGDALAVEAVIASLDGKRLYRDVRKGSCEEAETIGTALAERLLDAGGWEILHELGLLSGQGSAE